MNDTSPNAARADRIRRAVGAYMIDLGMPADAAPDFDTLRDFMTDTLHFARLRLHLSIGDEVGTNSLILTANYDFRAEVMIAAAEGADVLTREDTSPENIRLSGRKEAAAMR